jgi:hypothetical protein
VDTTLRTRLAGLDVVAPIRTRQLQLRIAAGRGCGLTSLALTTAVDLCASTQVLLVVADGTDTERLAERLAHLGLPDRSTRLTTLATDDLEEVLEELGRLSPSGGPAASVVLANGETLLAQPWSSGSTSAAEARLSSGLRPFLVRGAVALVHVRAELLGHPRANLRELRSAADTAVDLLRPGDHELVVLECTKNVGDPFADRRARLVLEDGGATDAVPRSSMSVRALLSYEEGRGLLVEALRHVDAETASAFALDTWNGTLDELLSTAQEFAPERAPH